MLAASAAPGRHREAERTGVCPPPPYPAPTDTPTWLVLKSTLAGHPRVHAEGYICKIKGGAS